MVRRLDPSPHLRHHRAFLGSLMQTSQTHTVPLPAFVPPVTPNEVEIVLRPYAGWLDVDVADVWRHRDLVALFVWRDFVARCKQTVLGPPWVVLPPLLMTV